MTDITNEHLASSMQKHGVAQADIERVIGIRNRMRAELNSQIRGMNMSDKSIAEAINAELQKVGDQVRAHGDRTKLDIDGLRADMNELRQHVASSASISSDAGSGESIGSSAVEQFHTDAGFQGAAETVGRKMKAAQFSARINVDSSIKAALTNEGLGQTGDTSIPVRPDRGGVYGPLLRPLRLLDVLPSRPVSSNSVEFMQIQSSGEAAEQLREGDEKAEIDLEGELKHANVVTIAGHTTASAQVLDDNPALGQLVDRVIEHKVLSRLESQLINGPGGEGRINGLLNQAVGFVPSIGETPADRIGEALVSMTNNGYAPSLVLMNPMDWFRIQLTKDADGNYMFGSPTSKLSPSLWNGRIVTTPALATGTVLVLDTSFITVLDRQQVSVTASNTHKDYFTRNLVAILGELRAGLEVVDVNAVMEFPLAAEPANLD